MPDYHTTIRLMNTDFPVTVTWDVCGVDDGAPEYEIEAVVSDLLGDVTHLVLNSLQGHTFLDRVHYFGWQDPIHTAMFGRDTIYQVGDSRLGPQAQPWHVSGSWGRPQMVQREPVRTVFRTFGDLRQKICDEIDALPELDDRIATYLDYLRDDYS